MTVFYRSCVVPLVVSTFSGTLLEVDSRKGLSDIIRPTSYLVTGPSSDVKGDVPTVGVTGDPYIDTSGSSRVHTLVSYRPPRPTSVSFRSTFRYVRVLRVPPSVFSS